jgi:hypothetical protein
MSDEPEIEMRKCRYCGRMTPKMSNFCRWCTRELEARPERPDSSSQSKPVRFSWLWIALLLAAAAGALFLLLR